MQELTLQEPAPPAAPEPRVQLGTLEVIGAPVDRARLFGKLAKVLGDMERVPKNGHNVQQNYRYATEGDALDTVRPALSEHGLALLATVDRVERTETPRQGKAPMVNARALVRFTLCCADTGAMATAVFEGEGQDTGDKANYKAYTGASKYFVLKTFLLSTGDDPEASSAGGDDRQQGGGRQERREARREGRQGGDRSPAPAQPEQDITPPDPELLELVQARLQALPEGVAGTVSDHQTSDVKAFLHKNLARIERSAALADKARVALEQAHTAVAAARTQAAKDQRQRQRQAAGGDLPPAPPVPDGTTLAESQDDLPF